MTPPIKPPANISPPVTGLRSASPSAKVCQASVAPSFAKPLPYALAVLRSAFLKPARARSSVPPSTPFNNAESPSCSAKANEAE